MGDVLTETGEQVVVVTEVFPALSADLALVNVSSLIVLLRLLLVVITNDPFGATLKGVILFVELAVTVGVNPALIGIAFAFALVDGAEISIL